MQCTVCESDLLPEDAIFDENFDNEPICVNCHTTFLSMVESMMEEDIVDDVV